MFKKIILAAALVVSAAFAQSPVNIGGRAAVDMGTMWGDKNDAEWGVGFNAGINAKIGINEMLAFVPGLEIDLRRITGEQTGYDGYRSVTVDETLTMWYLDIPMVLRINANPQFFIDAGLYLGFNLSAEAKLEAAGESVTQDIGETMETLDIGLIAGVGYNVMPNLDLNFRLALGLTEMGKNGKGSKNMRLQLGATYWFM
ncbi:porin family protein [Fibrobacter sp. UWB12]|uniref:porin family protein n=1 Tax=Fibrobacter sp. UWB12 TaxID=1896203 RepID=UPI00091A6D39|nr:porin family protein [Fibrobacter sp. UWB12]SHK37724.1 Outer membrane protein beta-barrel domain-containing protein [Fibrobacter sp. UWB12]